MTCEYYTYEYKTISLYLNEKSIIGRNSIKTYSVDNPTNKTIFWLHFRTQSGFVRPKKNARISPLLPTYTMCGNNVDDHKNGVRINEQTCLISFLFRRARCDPNYSTCGELYSESGHYELFQLRSSHFVFGPLRRIGFDALV